MNRFQDSSFREEARAILTRDMLQRRERNWPLIKISYFPAWLEGKMSEFPALHQILDKYRGKLTLCGGLPGYFLLNVPLNNKTSLDADLFFHNVMETEANQMLEDCVATIVAVETKLGRSVRIERRQFITNVVSQRPDAMNPNESWITRTYQFVQRIYPSLNAVLGGFDIPLSSFAYDGIELWATESAYWSIHRHCIVVDTTRRSTSYEHRLLKYCRRFGCDVFFPGLDYSTKENMPVEDLVRQIAKQVESNRMTFCNSRGRVKMPLTWLFDHLQPSNVRHEFDRIYATTNGKVNVAYKSLDDPLRRVANIKRYSDYSDSRMLSAWIPAANATMLRANNCEGVMTFTEWPAGTIVSEQDVRTAFQQLVRSPCVQTSPIMHFGNPQLELSSWSIKAMGIFQDKIINNKQFTLGQQAALVREINQHVTDEARRMETVLTGISWITTNPGRQWTSSCNPIFEDPRQFYGPNYVPFWIGIPCEIETTLRLFRLRTGNFISMLPRDVFNLLLKHLTKLYTYKTE